MATKPPTSNYPSPVGYLYGFMLFFTDGENSLGLVGALGEAPRVGRQNLAFSAFWFGTPFDLAVESEHLTCGKLISI